MIQTDEIKEDDRPSNTLEHFTELKDVVEMIRTLQPYSDKKFEKEYEHFTEVLTRYQEQPHLLDPHLGQLLQQLLDKIRNPSISENEMHSAFKYLYVICKVRTFKVLVKFLPHELSDLEFALELLERQNPKEFDNWETRYMLLLWMSILVLNPFHMSRLDAYKINNQENSCDGDNCSKTKTKMERIYDICKIYSYTNDTCSNISAFLSAKYFIRSDIKDIYLEPFFDWVISQHSADTIDVKFGQLAAVGAILKHGKREDLLPYADKLLNWIVSCKYKNNTDFLKYKYYIKIIQRIGLIYLKPRIASWRYKRGTRSLTSNLSEASSTNFTLPNNNGGDNLDIDEEAGDEVIVPDAIEDVIEELLQGLRSGGNDIRWSAAKGIGRVTNRLSKELGDEIIGSVIEILNPLEPHEAWHGGCLAIAELAKRGLLLPYRLKELVPILLQALFYDEMKGYMSVGQHIRDAACYMCWAFARAYNPEDLQPFVMNISAGLLTVAVFDREINCRRAASAAFQESVGRLGNFPYGIPISTTIDFFSVGMRQNSFLNLSDYIAQYKEYCIPLIDHLVEKKVNHWDTSIRDLTAKSLHKLTYRAPEYMAESVMAELLAKTNSIDLNTRHGSILAIGEITLALRRTEIARKSSGNAPLLTNQILSDLNDLMGKFLSRDMFRGMSGEMMKQCCTDFIKNCSLARIEVNPMCIVSWQQIIDKCLINKTAPIRESATIAFGELALAYYCTEENSTLNESIIKSYIDGAEGKLEEHIRMGYVSALGALPRQMVLPYLDEVIECLVKHAITPEQALQNGELSFQAIESVATGNWSEARRDSVKALNNLVRSVGFNENKTNSFSNVKYFNRVIECLLKAMDEYTLDNRGDIGAWVREAAMSAIYTLLIACPKNIVQPEHIHEIMLCFVQQSVEKIDRTRGLAGRLFCNLLNAKPEIPHIKQLKRLHEIFPEDSSTVLWLFADHTFPLFCSMLELPEYSKRILLGLSASIGQLTESLMKYSASSLFQYLRTHPNDIPRLCKEIKENFNENVLNERVTYPMLSFLDILIGSGTVTNVILNENDDFSEEIFRLLNLEVKGHKKLYKLVSSINVYCQLVQVPALCKRILSKLAIFLGLTHVHVRKTTATKLYEALALHGEVTDIPEENMDEILSLLSETDWGLPLLEIRPIRNDLCKLMGIKPPISGSIPTVGIPFINRNNVTT